MTDAAAPDSAADHATLEQRLGRFLDPATFRVLIAARSWLDDLLFVIPATILAVIVELAIGHADVSPEIVAGSRGQLHALLALRAQDWYPAAIAGAVLLACLRLSAHVGLHRAGRRIGGSVVAGVAIFGLAALELGPLPGSPLQRYVPLALAAYAVLRLPRWRDRRRTGSPTVAGCRPSRRARLTPRGHLALRNLAVGIPDGGLWTTNIFDETLEHAVAMFARRRDTGSEAYSWARAVEHQLALGQIVAAESYVRRAGERAPLVREPAVASATAQYLATVGRHAEAVSILLQVRQDDRSQAKPAFASLLVQIAAGIASSLPAGRHSTRMRHRQIFAGYPGAVLLDFAAEIRAAESSEPDLANRAGHQLCEVIHAVLTNPLSRALGGELLRIERARGIALTTIASVCERHHDPLDAANAYLDAVPAFQFVKDRTATCRCLARASALLLEHGRGSADQEAHALDLMRVAFEIVEAERGGLRAGESRAAWVREQRRLYAASFQRLAHDVHWHPARAAELGLWLIESLHRTTLAAAIRDDIVVTDQQLGARLEELARAEAAFAISAARLTSPPPGQPADTGDGVAASVTKARAALLAAFTRARDGALVVDPIEVGALRLKLGAAVAMVYQCGRDETGWTINCVTVCPDAEYLFQGHLAVSSDDPRESPCALLDAIAGRRLGAVARSFAVPLWDECWRPLEAGIIPPNLGAVLERASRAAGDGDLVIVPDGPLAGIPFAGMRLRNGRALGAQTRVRMLPSLSLLEHEPYSGPAKATVIVKHVDEVDPDSDSWQAPRSVVVGRRRPSRSSRPRWRRCPRPTSSRSSPMASPVRPSTTTPCSFATARCPPPERSRCRGLLRCFSAAAGWAGRM